MANQLILIRHGDIGDRYRGRYIGRTDAPLSAEGRRQAATLTGPVARLNGAHFLSSPLRRTRETAEIALGANGVLKNTPLWQAVQKCSDARRAKTEERGVYGNTSSDEVCSATQQMSVLEASRPQGGASRQRNGLFFTAPLIPANKAGIAGCAPGQQTAHERFEIDVNLREIDFGRWEGMSFAEIAAANPAAVDRWAALDEDFTFPDGEGIRAFRERIGAAAERIAADPAGTVVLFAHGGVIRFLICHFLGLPDRHHLLLDIRPASISKIRIDGGKGVLTLLNDRHHLEGC